MATGKGYKVTAAEKAALDANTSTPSASNPFATAADIVAGTNPLATAANQVIRSNGVDRVQLATAGVTVTPCTAGAGGAIVLAEATANGVNTLTMQAPASLGGNRTVTFPDASVDLTNVPTANIAAGLAAAPHAITGANPAASMLDVDAPSVGSVAIAELAVSANFADTETVTIGADTYRAMLVPALPADFLLTAIDIDATLDALAVLVNTVGTELVIANGPTVTTLASTLLIRFASAVGGPAIAGTPTSMALSSTCATAVWDKVNINTVGTDVSNGMAHGRLVVTAAQAGILGAAGAILLGSVPFAYKANSVFSYTVTNAAGVPLATPVTDEFAMVTAADGVAALSISAAGATHLAAGDIVSWTVVR